MNEMDDFVRGKNIELYRSQLARSSDPEKRAQLERLLAEEIAKEASAKRPATYEDRAKARLLLRSRRVNDP